MKEQEYGAPYNLFVMGQLVHVWEKRVKERPLWMRPHIARQIIVRARATRYFEAIDAKIKKDADAVIKVIKNERNLDNNRRSKAD